MSDSAQELATRARQRETKLATHARQRTTASGRSIRETTGARATIRHCFRISKEECRNSFIAIPFSIRFSPLLSILSQRLRLRPHRESLLRCIHRALVRSACGRWWLRLRCTESLPTWRLVRVRSKHCKDGAVKSGDSSSERAHCWGAWDTSRRTILLRSQAQRKQRNPAQHTANPNHKQSL